MHDALKRFFSFLKLPRFADAEKNTSVQILGALIATGFACLAVYAGIIWTFMGFSAVYWKLQTVLTTLVVLVIVFLILRQGHLRLAAQVSVIGVGFALAIAGFPARGVLGIAYASYAVLVVAASLLLGPRAGLLTALASSLTGAAMLYSQIERVDDSQWLNLFSSWAGESMLFFLCAGIVGFSSGKMRDAFAHAKAELAQREIVEREQKESENKLAMALKTARMGMWEWEISSGKLTWSSATEDVFHIPQDQFPATYDSYLQLVHPDDRDRLAQAISSSFGPIGLFSVEHRVVGRGREVWIESHGSVVRSSNGLPVRVVGTVLDITERKRASLIIEESETKFRTLVNNLNIGIMLQGPGAEILTVNQAALNLLGLEESQVVGKTSFDQSWSVIDEHGNDFPGDKHPVPVAIREKRVVMNVVMGVFRPTLRDRCWLLVNAIPELNPDRTIRQVLCTFTDITALREAQAAVIDNERQYRGFIELSPDGVAVHQDGSIVYANKTLAKILGARNQSDLIGRRVLDLVQHELRPLVLARIASVLEQNINAPVIEEQFQRLDGGLVDVEVAAAPHTWRNKPAVLVVVRDISARKEAEARARASETKYKTIFDNAAVGLFLLNRTTMRYADVNPGALQMLGYSREELLRMGPADLIPPEDLAANPIRPASISEGMVSKRRLRKKDGAVITVETRVNPISPDLALGIAYDITERIEMEKAALASEERWKLITRSVPAIIVLIDPEGRMLFINRVFEGWKLEEILGKNIMDFLPPGERELTPARLRTVFEEGREVEYEQTGAGSPGEERHYAGKIVPIRHEGKITAGLLIATDITARKKDVERLAYQASHDSLTDLPNRQFLIERALRAIEDAEKHGRQLALLLLDLDRFKEINDTLGHFTGDLLLKRIGPRMESYVISIGGEMARLGGDEFEILLPRISEPAEAEGIAQTFHHLLREPFLLEGMNLELDCSIGVAVYPFHGQDPISLLRCADVAMYLAKKRSAGVALYAPDQDRYSRRRLALLTELGLAIRENQLTLHYQPKYRLLDRKMVGVEALVRWQHPVHGMVSPGEFIPLAETGNLIVPLTNWVLEEAARQWRIWRDAKIPLKIAVNLSVRNLMDEQYPITVEGILRKYQIDRSQFELEITESAIMADPERALSVLNRLHALGVELSIDDFGTGYSSLSYLSKLPIDALKIDLSFVRQMMESERNMVIVNSTVRLAHTLGLRVIAEGVEDEPTLQTLSEMKCDMAQGYLFAPPRSAHDLTEQIRRDLPPH